MQTPTKARSSRPMATPIKGDIFGVKSVVQMGLNSPIQLVSALKTPKEQVASKDKVIVCVKARPVSSPECLEAYDLDPEFHTLSLSDTHSRVMKRGRKSGRAGEYTYSFDALHLPPAQTMSLYEENIAPLVVKCMGGFNSTIFAYGQTGSGKTHTMSGTRDDIGVIPLAISSVFQTIEEDSNRHYLLRVSYLEIYNESIRDLLVSHKKVVPESERPNIHVEKGLVQVRPLVEEIVKSPEEILELLQRGANNRKTGATDWNERSSRSHCVFTLTVESREGADVRRSKLTLIDLAGSEKAVSDMERMAEGKYINRSLLALGTVIEALSDASRKPGGHIPYRNSKLTHLLENALGGNANIAVICTLSLEERHQAETLETLKFASRCAQVQTKAVQGIIMASSEKAMLLAKEEEIAALRSQLDEMARQRPPSVSDIDEVDTRAELALTIQEMEARRSRLQMSLAMLNGQILSGRPNGFIASDSGGSIARRLRRRVSDHPAISASPSRFTTCVTPSKNSRRAVSSSIARLVEDSMDAEVPAASFTAADVASVVRYHRRNNSNQVNEIASGMTRTGLELEVTQELAQDVTNAECKYERELSIRMDREEELALERQAGAEKERTISEMAEHIARLEQEVSASRAETQRVNERVIKLNELGLPRPPANVSAEQSPTAGKQPILRHAGSLKEQRLASMDTKVETYTPSARAQKTREAEEIDKLNKIIEGLMTVQSELLIKVEDWQERVLDQNRRIQALTDGMLGEQTRSPVPVVSPPVSVGPTTPAAHPVLTPSRSIRSNLDHAPSTPTPREKKGANSSSLMSPGSPASYWGYSPRPIPMHEGMKSNASARKGRRLTVENDLERLQSSSRVDEGRHLFTR